MADYQTIAALSADVIKCRLCKRLVNYRESVPPRASYAQQKYWRRPVAGFGDLDARLVIIGLAPAAHGANRTGRVFTGDESGRFLVRALYEAGYSNQPISESIEDGLVLRDCYVTAAVRCAPPGNRPSQSEFENCSVYLDAELTLLAKIRCVLTLGHLAFRSFLDYAHRMGVDSRGLKFQHGRKYSMPGLPALYASYHPSPQNTYTGRLTERMLVALLGRIRNQVNRGNAPLQF